MALQTYTPLATGAAPTFGTSGDAVKALQTQLNTANAGQSGYTPLKVDGLYGPLTQAASTYKAPVAPTISTPVTPTAPTPAPIDTARYSRTANTNDSLISSLNTKLDNTVGDAPDLESITAQKKAAAQGQIDAITAEFNRIIDTQNNTNNTNDARVRASNISSGLGGSDFGTAKAVDQTTKNNKALDLINQEKTAKIEAILAGVDDRASSEYRTQREAYVKSLGDQLDRVKAAKDEDRSKALESIKSLAQQGVSIEKLKSSDPSTYDNLIKEYGGSQIDLESEWNDALPDQMKVKYQDKIVQGPNGKASLFRYGLNPATGTVDQKEYDLNVDFNTLNGVKPVNVNGRLFALTTDANGNEIAKPLTDVIKKTGTGSGTGSGKVVKSGKVTFSGDQMSAFSSELEKSKSLYNGDGKYVNPDSYQEAYDAWVQSGALGKDFLTQFPPAKYVNPENNTLPEYLRSANKTTSTTSKKASTTVKNPFAKTPAQ